jgi:phosphoserine phosphatase
MTLPRAPDGLSRDALRRILEITRDLARPLDLGTLLYAVVDAAKDLLHAEGGTVWQYLPDEHVLEMRVARGLDAVRIPADQGLAGECVRSLAPINVPDCYADARFNRAVDLATGQRTRCMLTLPLVDHKDVLVGVMQVLNKGGGGVFDDHDEALATALAAQCAVALQRVRMTEAVIEGEKMRQELEMARVVQMSTLPASMPALPGYDVYGTFKPAELTGGDTFDLAVLDQGLLVVLGDATGHGIAPALSVTQMQAMLRMAFRLGADLETAFKEVNNQLADTLASDRFITAFVGMLDANAHLLRFHSGGQGPILHFQAAVGTCARYKPTSFPLGAMRLSALRPVVSLQMQPGDILLLLSDGIYEYHNGAGEQFGEARVEEIVRSHPGSSMAQLSAILLEAIQAFAAGAAQDDDITVVLVKREAAPPGIHRSFERSFDSIEPIFAFTADTFARQGIDPEFLPVVDLAVEELFTNMVKYSTMSSAAVRIDLARIDGGVEVTLTDYDVEPFDVTQAPDADIELPIEQRKPGGLGLHLIRRLVDSIEYEYSRESRQARTTFRKTHAGRPDPGGAVNKGE